MSFGGPTLNIGNLQLGGLGGGGLLSFWTSVENLLPGAGIIPGLGGGYRPWQWAISEPQLVKVTVQEVTANTLATGSFHNILAADVSGVLQSIGSTFSTPSITTNKNIQVSTVDYFFDAVIREEHNYALHATEHPIQNGAAITDHAFLIPARVTLEIGISDAMDSFVPGQFGGFGEKSVGALIKMRQWQLNRLPIFLQTRLSSYQNLVIEDIRAHQDVSSFHSLKASIVFKQIFMSNVASAAQSARQNQTVETNPGASSVQSIPANVTTNNEDSNGDWSTQGGFPEALPSV